MAGDQGSAQPAAGMQVSWIAYAAILIVGFLSLFSLYMGFINYGDNTDIAIIFIFLGAAGFAAIGYMLFRGKPVATAKDDTLTIKKVEVYTTLECPKCQQKRVRDFKRGDYVFKDDEPCTRCDGLMVITKIARKKEEEDKKKKEESSWL
ncbi:TPA: hypothetical protein HA344_10185 [Candidatus Bathyarchaeota archaeon]|nr:hypothetical protein [Candidatus Bathyarchaeota archaeon]